MGLIPAKTGEVIWQGKKITHSRPHQRVQSGVAYVPQGREIFPRLTVEEKPPAGAVAIFRPRGEAGSG
ncbi:branched-chain amino acid transport system ATP-binding protein [Enterobacter asburiae]|uniref:Branched-chain amino acid transport system ATP-binding protein n=1 Tax=Enterobacter asburiae TaxID=61645 RepID=A0A376F7R4_ENTAS|nr:branched-chain amino acid transport system ATP-binding protein [Enterobacter asburiae]